MPNIPSLVEGFRRFRARHFSGVGHTYERLREGQSPITLVVACSDSRVDPAIVLDIMMPKLDGYETCKRLKAEDATKAIPVILLSAKGRNVDQKIGFEVGADDYITKPFSPRKLVERINAILGQGSSQQRMQA